MRRKFEQLTLNDLLEKLSDCTLQYSHLHTNGGVDGEFYRIRKDILELQQEIVRRKETADDDEFGIEPHDESDRFYSGKRKSSG